MTFCWWANDHSSYVYDSNMGYCGVCHEAGELVCCDTCPNAYHQKCAQIAEIPEGDWSCHWYASYVIERINCIFVRPQVIFRKYKRNNCSTCRCIECKKKDWHTEPSCRLKAESTIKDAVDKITPSSAKRKQFQLLSFIIDRLCEHDYAHIFLEPIPVDEIKGYSKIVARPMDIGTIRKRKLFQDTPFRPQTMN